MLKIIKGKTPNTKFLSVDGILDNMRKKIERLTEKQNKKNMDPRSFIMNDYADFTSYPIKQGINTPIIDRKIAPGDKILISIEHPQPANPASVWVAMRGIQS